jgi:glucose-1-phosphate thymidylyltransferase
MSLIVGILPSAGKASRLQPLRFPKQLLPIRYISSSSEDASIGLVIEHSLRALSVANVRTCFVVVSDNQPEILRYLQDGESYGLRLSYVVQPQPLGLAQAVDEIFPWVEQSQCITCLTLPDTIFEPITAVGELLQEIENGDADVVLGVFPTNAPEQLAPVEVDGAGVVKAVLEKPGTTQLRNTWGVAVWRPTFSKFLHEQLKLAPVDEELALSAVFDRACRANLLVRALDFSGGKFQDFGTWAGIGAGASDTRSG